MLYSLKIVFWTDIKLSQAYETVNSAEINDIIITYNTTNVLTCDQRPGYFKAEINVIFAIAGCFVIIGITLLIFLLIRWYFIDFAEPLLIYIRKSKNREVLVQSQVIRNQLEGEKCIHRYL